ncbi:MAG: phosphate signaling complex protein PhoU [Candidatus Binataceae bacterium]|jgi:phosphate transport system protein
MDRAPLQHTNSRYEQELSELRETLLRMGELVCNQIDDAIQCLFAGDADGAAAIAARDAEVNRLDSEIDESCVQILALNQPTAIDLRMILASLKITTDLERIGDQAVNICARPSSSARRVAFGVDAEIERMTTIAREMVKKSLRAFEHSDTALAKSVIETDDQIDALHRRVLDQLLNSMIDEPAGIGQGTTLLFVSRSLEKIADHATAVAESVVFMVEGRDIRHRERPTR